jgi:DNA-binding PadR family transcriptional regulator
MCDIGRAISGPIGIGWRFDGMTGCLRPPSYMRGMLSFLILSLLEEGDMYGSEIGRRIGRLSDRTPNPGTLYPALKRLEKTRTIKSYRGERGAER